MEELFIGVENWFHEGNYFISWGWDFVQLLGITKSIKTEFFPKFRQKSGKNRSKTGQKPGTLSRDQPEQLLLLDFFDYLKKTFPADSGRTGSPRANLRPFLKSPLNVEPFY